LIAFAPVASRPASWPRNNTHTPDQSGNVVAAVELAAGEATVDATLLASRSTAHALNSATIKANAATDTDRSIG
jgi:hypothetical protein